MGEAPIVPTGPPARRPFLLWLLAGIVVVVLTGAAIGVLVARDDANPDRAVTGTAQLVSIQEACGQWRDANTDSQVPSASWCTAMVGWMTAQMNGGHMTGAMMWGDPDRMRDTCQRWMATAPAVSGSSTNASAWCTAMVGWMTRNGAWNSGMFGSHMMGG